MLMQRPMEVCTDPLLRVYPMPQLRSQQEWIMRLEVLLDHADVQAAEEERLRSDRKVGAASMYTHCAPK